MGGTIGWLLGLFVVDPLGDDAGYTILCDGETAVRKTNQGKQQIVYPVASSETEYMLALLITQDHNTSIFSTVVKGEHSSPSRWLSVAHEKVTRTVSQTPRYHAPNASS